MRFLNSLSSVWNKVKDKKFNKVEMMEKLADSDEYISRLGKVDFKIFVIFKILKLAIRLFEKLTVPGYALDHLFHQAF